VYNISWCICKLVKYKANTHHHGGAARHRGARRRRALCVCFYIFDQFAYTPRNGIHQPFSYFFWVQTRWWCIYIYGVPILRVTLFTSCHGGVIYRIFELIEPARPNKDNATPCPCILILLTHQWGARPSIALKYMGMVLDCLCLALEAQFIQKSGK